MKKIFTISVMTLAFAGVMNAQRAAEYSFGQTSTVNKSYNRLSISYNNDTYKCNWHEDEDNYSSNGAGVNYIHGFSLSRSLPMFLETGVNFNFNLGKSKEYKYEDYKAYSQLQNINIQVPINYVYRINITDDFSIAPYLGLNFKLHLITKVRAVEIEDRDKEVYDWFSCYDKDEFGDDTWNRFQMGWHVGATFQYSRISLGIQYGTDFIPAYSYDEDKINTGSLKISLGYNF